MYFSYSLSKYLVLFHILPIQFLLIRRVLSLNHTNAYLIHKCGVAAESYGSRSKYEKYLNSEIREMSPYTFRVGYSESTYVEPPNSVTISFWCRGDSYGPMCRSCYDNAVAGLRRRCKKDIVGNIWYERCFLSFSGEKVINQTDYENSYSFHNQKDMSGDIVAFNKTLVELLNKLTVESSRSSQKKNVPVNYAAGEMKFGSKKVYAMVQCVQYLHAEFCQECLESNIKKISTCCSGKQGAMILNMICNVRYELYPFLSSYKTV